MRGSLASYDQDSSSWRTSQACLVSGWEPFSETWPRSGMMRHGTAYPLAPSAPLTGGIGFGLLPTPVATLGTKGGPNQRDSRGRPGLQMAAMMLPRPTATPYGSNKSASPNAAVRPSLETIAMMWPTPRSSPNENRQTKPTPSQLAGKHGMNLATAAAMFPTPAARDWRHPNAKPYSERGGGTKGEQLPNVVGGALNPTWVEWLQGFPLGWTEVE